MLYVNICMSICLQLVNPLFFLHVKNLIGLCLDPMQVFSLGLGPIMLFLAPEEG